MPEVDFVCECWLPLAREAHHCSSVLAGDALFADAAHVLFGELLGAALP